MSTHLRIGAAITMTAAVLLGGSAGHAQSKAKGPSLAAGLTTPTLKCGGFAKARAKVTHDGPFTFEGQLRFGSTVTPITVGKGKTEDFELAGDALACAGPLSLSVALLHKDPTKAQIPIATKTFPATRVNYSQPTDKFAVPNFDGFLAVSLPTTSTGDKGFVCGQPMVVTVHNKLVKEGKSAPMGVTLQVGAKKVAATYPGNSSTEVTLDTLDCAQGVPPFTVQIDGATLVKILVESVQF
jgi:hypothetical protein